VERIINKNGVSPVWDRGKTKRYLFVGAKRVGEREYR
jgi:hypothetical protein